MREILFRGKRTDNKQWIYGFYALIGKENPNAYIITNNGRKIRVCHRSIGQYTGITDVNSKKIFEGDIVDEYNSLGKLKAKGTIVTWDNLFSGWRLEENQSMFGGGIVANYKVIGNIHDNPELLKGGRQ